MRGHAFAVGQDQAQQLVAVPLGITARHVALQLAIGHALRGAGACAVVVAQQFVAQRLLHRIDGLRRKGIGKGEARGVVRHHPLGELLALADGHGHVDHAADLGAVAAVELVEQAVGAAAEQRLFEDGLGLVLLHGAEDIAGLGHVGALLNAANAEALAGFHRQFNDAGRAHLPRCFQHRWHFLHKLPGKGQGHEDVFAFVLLHRADGLLAKSCQQGRKGRDTGDGADVALGAALQAVGACLVVGIPRGVGAAQIAQRQVLRAKVVGKVLDGLAAHGLAQVAQVVIGKVVAQRSGRSCALEQHLVEHRGRGLAPLDELDVVGLDVGKVHHRLAQYARRDPRGHHDGRHVHHALHLGQRHAARRRQRDALARQQRRVFGQRLQVQVQRAKADRGHIRVDELLRLPHRGTQQLGLRVEA